MTISVSATDVGGSGRAPARPAVPPAGKDRVQVFFFVPVQFAAPVRHALDVQPHTQESFFFSVCPFVARPVVPGSHVISEFAPALVPAFFVVVFAGSLFPTGDFLQGVPVGGGERAPVVVLAASEEPYG